MTYHIWWIALGFSSVLSDLLYLDVAWTELCIILVWTPPTGPTLRRSWCIGCYSYFPHLNMNYSKPSIFNLSHLIFVFKILLVRTIYLTFSLILFYFYVYFVDSGVLLYFFRWVHMYSMQLALCETNWKYWFDWYHWSRLGHIIIIVCPTMKHCCKHSTYVVFFVLGGLHGIFKGYI